MSPYSRATTKGVRDAWPRIPAKTTNSKTDVEAQEACWNTTVLTVTRDTWIVLTTASREPESGKACEKEGGIADELGFTDDDWETKWREDCLGTCVELISQLKRATKRLVFVRQGNVARGRQKAHYIASKMAVPEASKQGKNGWRSLILMRRNCIEKTEIFQYNTQNGLVISQKAGNHFWTNGCC